VFNAQPNATNTIEDNSSPMDGNGSVATCGGGGGGGDGGKVAGCFAGDVVFVCSNCLLEETVVASLVKGFIVSIRDPLLNDGGRRDASSISPLLGLLGLLGL